MLKFVQKQDTMSTDMTLFPLTHNEYFIPIQAQYKTETLFLLLSQPHESGYDGREPNCTSRTHVINYDIVLSVLTECNPHMNKDQLPVLVSTVHGHCAARTRTLGHPTHVLFTILFDCNGKCCMGYGKSQTWL